MSLLERTKTLLSKHRDSGLSLRQIAELSDGAVDHEWLKKFSADEIPDPSVNRVQRLHDSLKSIRKHGVS